MATKPFLLYLRTRKPSSRKKAGQGMKVKALLKRLKERKDDPIDRRGQTMKKIVEDVSGEGLEQLLGEQVTLFCLNYIYHGTLVGVNDTCVLLDNAGIVYETGELTSQTWRDRQALPNAWYVQRSAIESFGVLK